MIVGATIEIGGELPEDALIDLLAAAEDDGAILEGRQPEYDDEDLRLAIAGGCPLRFTRARAPNEQFTELEALCHARGLTYRRFGDGGPSGQPGVVFWAPGAGEPVRAPSDLRGRVYFTLEDLHDAADQGLQLPDVIADLAGRSGIVPSLRIVPSA
jgi:hypothetical protein